MREKQDYRLVLVDLDGTLLTDDKRISERNKAAIRAAREKGVITTICTGRMRGSTVQYAREIELGDTPFITFSGSRIETVAGDIIYRNSIDERICRRLIDEAVSMGVTPIWFSSEEYAYANRNADIDSYAIFHKREGIHTPDYMTAPIDTPKMSVRGEEEKLCRYTDWIRAEYKDIRVLRFADFALEITDMRDSKGVAMKRLAQVLGIDTEKCIAIGDEELDIPMIEAAGMGVCMENGRDCVKAAADYICASNEEDGVAQVIERFILD